MFASHFENIKKIKKKTIYVCLLKNLYSTLLIGIKKHVFLFLNSQFYIISFFENDFLKNCILKNCKCSSVHSQ